MLSSSNPIVGNRKERKRILLLPGEIAHIKAEVKRLEDARKECHDGGIQKRIDIWIEELQKKLVS